MAMATQRNKTLSLPMLAFITLILVKLKMANSSSSLSFSYDRFESVQHDLIFQGDAKVSSSNTLQLTRREKDGTSSIRSVGRVLYSTPLRLWDNVRNNEASFETTFTFRLTTTINHPAQGLAFFIAPPNTTIPPDSIKGYLGLFNPQTALNASANQIVHVEFDTYPDPEWGEVTRHIGININSIKSAAYVPWERKEGEIVSVQISYIPDSGRLRVISFYPSSKQYVVSHVIRFKSVLPEWVRVGFSASTGDYTQTHEILSWSFRSSWKSNKDNDEEYSTHYE